ncbi:UbiD family decarboxylase [Streptomyces sp. NBC_00264]|uniref:UbiD family decarboxylase n=1 Tax=unclassified Streptomyces TaxID=2593676 RepID=UPI00225197A0|nr:MULTISPECIES: UbiD family decarboxylase [unclassified Streptomyces]MCX5158475.1 UbiD family decarboxylase [Streptomyces sp. NBC_00305]MCX5216998.1 UbiD family decarboxylase [Streptomyces sp. NBC_00264]
MTQRGSALNFRDFVENLLATGDAVDIREPVSPLLEAAAITRRVYETNSPAPLFSNLTGTEAGFRILGAPAGLSGTGGNIHGRLAAHFGLPAGTAPRELLEHLIAAMHAEPVAPRVVETGPCKENVLTGDDVDLERFPVPLLHEHDGGRYLGTYGYHVVRTPDGRWTNWSISRTMLHGRTTLVGPAMAQQHLGMIHAIWRDRGLPTPWAMVLGAPPAALAAAGMPLPAEVNEDGYVGALAGSPVEVVRTELHDLHVPANSEIVLEGWISPDETAPEGPMGEYHGYAFAESKPQPVFHVEAMTFRDDPILPICVAGLPPEENHTIWGTMISAVSLDLLRASGLPVDLAWCSYEAATCWIVVSIDIRRLARSGMNEKELADAVAEVLFGSHTGWLVPKVLLVADDIDITDIDQVVWAMATRHHPGTGTYCYPQAPGIPMVPYLTPEEVRTGHGGKSVTSCLLPEQFEGVTKGVTASFRHSFPDRVRSRVEENWTAYGFAEGALPPC